MNPLYDTPHFTAELLLVCSALREVGLDEVADRFRDALLDRPLVEVALQALRDRVRNSSNLCASDQELPWSQDDWLARQTAFWMLQRLERLIN